MDPYLIDLLVSGIEWVVVGKHACSYALGSQASEKFAPASPIAFYGTLVNFNARSFTSTTRSKGLKLR